MADINPLTKAGGLNFEGWYCILMYVASEYGGHPSDDADPEWWRDVYDRNYTPQRAIREDFDLSINGGG